MLECCLPNFIDVARLEICQKSGELWLEGERKVVSQLRICRPSPPPFRSDHLDIKDMQFAENKGGRKILCHIISRLGAAGVQKGPSRRPKIQFSLKVAKFAGNIVINLTLIFCSNDFLVRFLVFEI